MDLKNRPVNKTQEVRGKVRTTFSEAPNSGLTIGRNIFIAARLNLCYLSFGVIFFSFLPLF